MIGIDAHKQTFTAVAVDEVGRQLGQHTLKSTSGGCFELVRWASRGPERGKSDPFDALAVARVAQREPDRPRPVSTVPPVSYDC
jgi:transposase